VLFFRGTLNKKKKSTSMKGLSLRALCAVALASLAGAAYAAPIYFNFTGTITSTTGTYANSGLEGTAVSGGFAFDTAHLTPFLSPDLAIAQFYETPVSTSHAYLNYGSGSISTPSYAQENGASLFFADTDCYQLSICNPLYPYQEGFSIAASSQDVDSATWVQTPGYVGQIRQSVLNVSSWDFDFADFAAFDWASATPIDIVTQALHDPAGFYSDDLYTCTGEPSCQYEQVSAFSFSIGSVTRGIVTADVPEPGTPALIVVGLAGLFWIRRRDVGNVPVQRLASR
jgi:hypothetical protein